MRIPLICLLLLTTFEALPQVFTRPPRFITGVVVDAQTRDPIYDVKIAQHFGTMFASTDSSGVFRIEKTDRDSLIFNHDYYKTSSIRLFKDTVVQVVLEKKCCTSNEEAREVFKELCRRKMRYPARARRMKTQGEVLIGFSLDEQLNIQNVRIIKDIGDTCGESASQFVQTLPVEMKRMLAYLGTKELVLPVIYLQEKYTYQFNPPATDATVLEPVPLVALGIRAVH
jgi:TonB family protein